MDEKRCSTCHLVRPMTDFNVRSAAPDGRQSRCRECARAWYVAHKDEHVLNVRLRNTRVRADLKERLAAYLLEHPCVDCGETDVRVLDFDHEDPSQKAGDIARLAACSMSWERITAEIDKCSVRCANCHRRRTADVRGYWRSAVEARRRAQQQARAGERLSVVLGV